MLRTFIVLTAATALLGASQDLAAQRIAVDLRAVGATSTQKLAGADLGLGAGFGITFGYQLQPHLLAYGGWDWIHFQANQSLAGPDMDFDETGYTAGLRFEHPIGAASLTLFRIEGGPTYKQVEIENVGGDIVGDSGHSFGFGAGGGLVFALGEDWRLTPTLRFRSLSPAFDVTGVTTKSDLRYAGIELGVVAEVLALGAVSAGRFGVFSAYGSGSQGSDQAVSVVPAGTRMCCFPSTI